MIDKLIGQFTTSIETGRRIHFGPSLGTIEEVN